MTKLTAKKRDVVRALLGDHEVVVDALAKLGKRGYQASLSVSGDNDNDFVCAEIGRDISQQALSEQKAWIEAELAKHGIEVC